MGCVFPAFAYVLQQVIGVLLFLVGCRSYFGLLRVISGGFRMIQFEMALREGGIYLKGLIGRHLFDTGQRRERGFELRILGSQ